MYTVDITCYSFLFFKPSASFRYCKFHGRMTSLVVSCRPCMQTFFCTLIERRLWAFSRLVYSLSEGHSGRNSCECRGGNARLFSRCCSDRRDSWCWGLMCPRSSAGDSVERIGFQRIISTISGLWSIWKQAPTCPHYCDGRHTHAPTVYAHTHSPPY